MTNQRAERTAGRGSGRCALGMDAAGAGQEEGAGSLGRRDMTGRGQYEGRGLDTDPPSGELGAVLGVLGGVLGYWKLYWELYWEYWGYGELYWEYYGHLWERYWEY